MANVLMFDDVEILEEDTDDDSTSDESSANLDDFEAPTTAADKDGPSLLYTKERKTCLDYPILSHAIQRLHAAPMIAAAASMQGERVANEDTHCMRIYPDGQLFAAVFDGHGGTQVARHLASEMQVGIEHLLAPHEAGLTSSESERDSDGENTIRFDSPQWPARNKSATKGLHKETSDRDLGSSHHSLRRTDEFRRDDFMRARNPIGPGCREIEELCLSLDRECCGLEGGATAAFAIVCPEADELSYEIIIGHVGDARAILAERRQSSTRLLHATIDHTPLRERARIERSGAFVTRGGRVNCGPNVARAFGDASFKTGGALIAQPDIVRLVARPSPDAEPFLIICCDGVFDTTHPYSSPFTNETLASFVAAELTRCPDVGAAAAAVCGRAIANGSGDNVTCVVLRIPHKSQMVSKSAPPTSSLVVRTEGDGSVEYHPGPLRNNRDYLRAYLTQVPKGIEAGQVLCERYKRVLQEGRVEERALFEKLVPGIATHEGGDRVALCEKWAEKYQA